MSKITVNAAAANIDEKDGKYVLNITGATKALVGDMKISKDSIKDKDEEIIQKIVNNIDIVENEVKIPVSISKEIEELEQEEKEQEEKETKEPEDGMLEW